MKESILVFTAQSFCYDETKENAKKRLVRELKTRNASAKYCFVINVTDLPDGTVIDHDFEYREDFNFDNIETQGMPIYIGEHKDVRYAKMELLNQ